MCATEQFSYEREDVSHKMNLFSTSYQIPLFQVMLKRRDSIARDVEAAGLAVQTRFVYYPAQTEFVPKRRRPGQALQTTPREGGRIHASHVDKTNQNLEFYPGVLNGSWTTSSFPSRVKKDFSLVDRDPSFLIFQEFRQRFGGIL